MNSSDSRIGLIEDSLKRAWRAIQNLLDRMTRAEQRIQSIPGGGSGGSGGSPAGFVCVLVGSVGAGGTPGSGSPGFALSGQAIYSADSSGYTLITSSAAVYNGMPNAVSSGKTVILLQNSDGSYLIIAVAC